MDNSKLPMEKRGKLEKDAQIMIKVLPKQVEYEKKMNSTTKKPTSDAIGISGTKLNKAVKFDYSDKEGRFVKTDRDVKVGEEILVENPVCSTLMEKFSKSHCQHCLAK